MKKSLLSLSLVMIFMTGCASLTDAGHVAYTVKPSTASGCEFSATDGKEFASRSINMTTTQVGCEMLVMEGASSAFQGQAIAGKALSVLPSFAAPILSPGPASVLPLAPKP